MKATAAPSQGGHSGDVAGPQGNLLPSAQAVVGSWGGTQEAEACPGEQWASCSPGLHYEKGSPVGTTLIWHCNWGEGKSLEIQGLQCC